MKEEEKVCSECKEVNLVAKSYNCSKCRTWNKFDAEPEEGSKKKGKKWLG